MKYGISVTVSDEMMQDSLAGAEIMPLIEQRMDAAAARSGLVREPRLISWYEYEPCWEEYGETPIPGVKFWRVFGRYVPAETKPLYTSGNGWMPDARYTERNDF